MANRVGTKGQLVIEKEIRDELGIEPGARSFQRIVNGQLVITFDHNRSLAGILRPLIKPEVLKELEGLEWHEIKERAWEAAIREDLKLDRAANAEVEDK
jgi:bifunctional DNA-binding transcriptional regulator/antitoxin component of YhaV-PrlF toxin-antitoxin module